MAVGMRGRRYVSKSTSAAIFDDARVQSVVRLTRFEIAAPPPIGRAAHVRLLVSTTKPASGSAKRKEEKYGSSRWASPDPPCPWRSNSVVRTVSASSAERARSKPRRTRSIPSNAGGCSRGRSTVQIFSFPIATPCSLTPCSTPHNHVGREPRNAWAPGSAMVRYCVRSAAPAARRACHSTTCASSACRSEFFANNIAPFVRTHSVSHISCELSSAHELAREYRGRERRTCRLLDEVIPTLRRAGSEDARSERAAGAVVLDESTERRREL